VKISTRSKVMSEITTQRLARASRSHLFNSRHNTCISEVPWPGAISVDTVEPPPPYEFHDSTGDMDYDQVAATEKVRWLVRRARRMERASSKGVLIISKGSKNHFRGQCRPCMDRFMPAGCARKEQCNFCHFHHSEEQLIQMALRSSKTRHRYGLCSDAHVQPTPPLPVTDGRSSGPRASAIKESHVLDVWTRSAPPLTSDVAGSISAGMVEGLGEARPQIGFGFAKIERFSV